MLYENQGRDGTGRLIPRDDISRGDFARATGARHGAFGIPAADKAHPSFRALANRKAINAGIVERPLRSGWPDPNDRWAPRAEMSWPLSLESMLSDLLGRVLGQRQFGKPTTGGIEELWDWLPIFAKGGATPDRKSGDPGRGGAKRTPPIYDVSADGDVAFLDPETVQNHVQRAKERFDAASTPGVNPNEAAPEELGAAPTDDPKDDDGAPRLRDENAAARIGKQGDPRSIDPEEWERGFKSPYVGIQVERTEAKAPTEAAGDIAVRKPSTFTITSKRDGKPLVEMPHAVARQALRAPDAVPAPVWELLEVVTRGEITAEEFQEYFEPFFQKPSNPAAMPIKVDTDDRDGLVAMVVAAMEGEVSWVEVAKTAAPLLLDAWTGKVEPWQIIKDIAVDVLDDFDLIPIDGDFKRVIETGRAFTDGIAAMETGDTDKGKGLFAEAAVEAVSLLLGEGALTPAQKQVLKQVVRKAPFLNKSAARAQLAKFRKRGVKGELHTNASPSDPSGALDNSKPGASKGEGDIDPSMKRFFGDERRRMSPAEREIWARTLNWIMGGESEKTMKEDVFAADATSQGKHADKITESDRIRSAKGTPGIIDLVFEKNIDERWDFAKELKYGKIKLIEVETDKIKRNASQRAADKVNAASKFALTKIHNGDLARVLKENKGLGQIHWDDLDENQFREAVLQMAWTSGGNGSPRKRNEVTETLITRFIAMNKARRPIKEQLSRTHMIVVFARITADLELTEAPK